jgi:pimeloyl-ACP methyl ester carboxylesterase
MVVSFSANANALEPDRHTVVVDGHPLALWGREVSNPKAHILLLHGRTWSALPDFDLQVKGEDLSFMSGLNELGYSAWALDARGYGSTPRDSTGWLTPDRATADVTAVLGWLRNKTAQKPHLFGWSYGSMLAQLVGQSHGDLIASVILFGYPVHSGYRFSAPDIQEEPARASNTAINAASDFITPGSISAAAIDAYVEQALAADPVRADWKNLHQWQQLDAGKLNLPTLLLQAEFDPLAKTASHADVFTKIPNQNKQWVVLSGGDHAALLEKPRAKMLHAISEFIQWLDK